MADFSPFYHLENLYKTKMSTIFIDLLKFKLEYSDTLDKSDFNLFQKVIVNYCNTGVFKEFIGGAYQLGQFMDTNHFVVRDVDNKSNIDSLYCDPDILYSLTFKSGESAGDYVSDFLDSIGQDIYNEHDGYLEKRLRYFNNTHIVPVVMNDDELEFQEAFYKSALGLKYTENFKSNTIVGLLKEKIHQEEDISVTLYEKFSDYYPVIKDKFQHKFYPDYIGSEHQFEKELRFLEAELNLAYMKSPSDQRDDTNNSDPVWVLFLKNDQYMGGSVISNGLVSDIRNISLRRPEANVKNFTKAIQEMLSSDFCKKDVFLTAPEIEHLNLDSSIREQFKDKRVYFSHKDKTLYYNLFSFIQTSQLTKYSEKILDQFYQDIINGKDQNALQSDMFSDNNVDLIMTHFKNKIFKQYSKKPKNGAVVDRERFINQCISATHDESRFLKYLDNNYNNVHFQFTTQAFTEESLDFNIINQKVESHLSSLGYQLNESLKEKLHQHIQESCYKVIVCEHDEKEEMHEAGYSFHALYDFMNEHKLVEQSNNTYVYRLEYADGKGVYLSEEKSENPIDSNLKDIYDYAQRKMPVADLGISTLFDISRYFLKTNSTHYYREQYKFGFADKSQLTGWFIPSEINTLLKSNVKLFRYELPANNVISSKVQVAFNEKYTVNKKELDLKEFLDMKVDKKPTLKRNSI